MSTGKENDEKLTIISDSLRRDYPELETTLTRSGTALLMLRLGTSAASLAIAAFLFLDPIVGIASFYLCCVLLAIGATGMATRGGQLIVLHRGRRRRPTQRPHGRYD